MPALKLVVLTVAFANHLAALHGLGWVVGDVLTVESR